MTVDGHPRQQTHILFLDLRQRLDGRGRLQPARVLDLPPWGIVLDLFHPPADVVIEYVEQFRNAAVVED
ncbi:hypothetical protein GCM10010401_13320 [Rarobacter faecitabidus]|uniref:Uncharacterized protein n=1 Tax=Rarobacter faecitabidus TaxID=13243 RepID=A0A542ZEB0_RARFA|nr:hypothetical protein [Rarobacter faecitabidus]TQL58619.1 hypothetical protein FB461_2037 [Rarobacter faecitabidus]